MKAFVILPVIIILCQTAFGDTIPAIIDGTVEVTSSGDPHIVPWDVVINEGATLNITSGTEIIMEASDVNQSGDYPEKTEFIVHGTLNLMGKVGSFVEFYSEGGSHGTWGQIKYEDGSRGFISHVKIKHSTKALTINSVPVDYIADVHIDSSITGIEWLSDDDSLHIAGLRAYNFEGDADGARGISIKGDNVIANIKFCQFRFITGPVDVTGGVIFNTTGSTADFSSCMFIGTRNGILADRVSFTANHLTIHEFTDYGISVGFEGYTAEVTNTLVTSGGVGLRAHSGASMTSDWNDVWDNQVGYEGVDPGSQDISVNPGYVDPEHSMWNIHPAHNLASASSTGGEMGFFGGPDREYPVSVKTLKRHVPRLGVYYDVKGRPALNTRFFRIR